MHIETRDFTQDPLAATREGFDCVWVCLKARRHPQPLVARALQWIDWRLQGQISRYLLAGGSERVTFVPSLRKVASPYIALEGRGSKRDWEAFRRNCQGLGWKRILWFCENPEAAAGLEGELRSLKGQGWPETVVIGTERAESETPRSQ